MSIDATGNQGPHLATPFNNSISTAPFRSEGSAGFEQLGPKSGGSARAESLSGLGPCL